IRAVQVRVGHALGTQLLHPLLCTLTQVSDRAELDRVRRARLRARRLETDTDAVIAQRALLRCARRRVHVDHTERTCGDARSAAVADVRLDDDGIELGADDRAGRTDLETA